MPNLKVADNLELPIGAVTQKLALLARSGAGKTNTAVVIVEELLEAQQQVVILDPPGAWWGLRSSADGSNPGYPVVILGGLHGDAPLEPASGIVVADLVVDHGLSAVVDLSEFTDSDMARFVAAFAQRLYARKNSVRDPMLLVLEEADELAPQNPKGEGPVSMMLHHIERIAKRGRMRGIGLLAISQRSAALNKHVLSQAEVLVAMQTTAPQDIAAIDEWVKMHGDQERRRQLLAEIAGLPVGSAFVWSPSWLGIFQRVRFRKRRTFDSSATPEPGKRQIAPKTLADVDLAALQKSMAATIEKAKADDPRELRRRIAELERTLKKPAAAVPPQTVEVERIVEVVPNALVALLRAQANQLDKISEDLAAYAHNFREVAERLPGADATPRFERVPRTPVPRIPPVPREHRRPPPSSPAPRPEMAPSGELSRPQQRILDALASLAAVGVSQPMRANVAVFADQSPSSSGFQNNLSALRTRGLIDYPTRSGVSLTDAGRELAAPIEAITSLNDLHAAWQRKLSGPQWRIVSALIAVHPHALSREDAAERSQQSPTSSGYQNNLSALRTLGLLDYPSRGEVVATDLLFPEVLRLR